MSARLRALFGGRAWLILFGALLLRVAIVKVTGNQLGGDAFEYDRYARSLASGHGYPLSSIAQSGPTAFFPPMYPGFLGTVYGLTGDSLTAARLAQALLGTLVVALIGVVCHQIWNRRIALVAMAAAAVYPPFLLAATTLLSEPLFLVFELAALVAVLEHRISSHRYRWAVVAGALAGLAILTRANGVVLLVPLVFGVVRPRPRLALRSYAQPLVLVAVALLVVAPWSVRNCVVFDRFLPLTTQADVAAARNYNPTAASQSKAPNTPRNTKRLLRLVRAAPDEAEVASRAGALGRRYMVHHPGYVIETVMRNSARALGFMDGRTRARQSATTEGASLLLAGAGVYSFYVFGGLALVGALAPAARRAPWWVWAIPVLLWLSVAWLAAGRPRYRIPVDPFVIMLAGIALVEGWDRLRLRLGGAEDKHD